MPLLVIFDLDGTLVDSRADIATATNHVRSLFSLEALPTEAVADCIGDGVSALLERTLPALDRGTAAKARDFFRERYAECCADRTRPFPGIPELLDDLRARGDLLAVCTNKPSGFTRTILAATGLADAFVAVEGGDRARKPDPDQIHAIVATADAADRERWIVGDNHTDICAGRAAGCRVAWAGWGFGDDRGLAVDLTLESPADFLADDAGDR